MADERTAEHNVADIFESMRTTSGKVDIGSLLRFRNAEVKSRRYSKQRMVNFLNDEIVAGAEIAAVVFIHNSITAA